MNPSWTDRAKQYQPGDPIAAAHLAHFRSALTGAEIDVALVRHEGAEDWRALILTTRAYLVQQKQQRRWASAKDAARDTERRLEHCGGLRRTTEWNPPIRAALALRPEDANRTRPEYRA